MSLSKAYAEMVLEQKRHLPFIHPLICGAEFSAVKPKTRCHEEYEYVLQALEKNKWQQLPPLLESLHNPHTAVILTDLQQKIQWVNKGFFLMTGYRFEEVLGKNPRFLQGKETSSRQKAHIRCAISQEEPFTTIIRNYRKSGEAYNCQVTIYPLFNREQELVNFMAIENETHLQAG